MTKEEVEHSREQIHVIGNEARNTNNEIVLASALISESIIVAALYLGEVLETTLKSLVLDIIKDVSSPKEG